MNEGRRMITLGRGRKLRMHANSRLAYTDGRLRTEQGVTHASVVWNLSPTMRFVKAPDTSSIVRGGKELRDQLIVHTFHPIRP